MVGYRRIAKKVLVSSCLLLTLLSFLAVDTPTANAVTYPAQPVKTPPTITVNSPQGTYTTSNLTLNFTVNAPEAWYKDGTTLVYFRNVTYQLDSNAPLLIWTNGQRTDGQDYTNMTPGELTYNISGLGKGSHTILINVTISSVYSIFGSRYPDGHFPGLETWNTTKTIFFNVENASSPIETSTPKPTPSASIPEFPIAAAISLLAVVSIPLVFFKRRKPKTA